jgi:hypothetical protein
MPTTLLIAAHRPHTHWQRAIAHAVLHGDLATVSWQQVEGQFHWQQAIPAEALVDLYEILPCLSLQTHGEWGYQCTLEYAIEDGLGHRSTLAPIGTFSAGDDRAETAVGSVRADTDIWRIDAPLSRATIHWNVQCAAPLDEVSALLSVSLRHRGQVPTPTPADNSVELVLPTRSQMQLRADLANRVCSPTSVSMVLEFYRKKNDVYDIIAEAQHQPSGLYGVWPANIHAAARRGLMGYLLHFPDWPTARDLLDKGLPIIASVRYEEGQLSAGAIAKTRGHLLVVRGYRGDQVLVNDPAAKSDAEVARAYNLREFCEVWLARSAVGYVLFAEGED